MSPIQINLLNGASAAPEVLIPGPPGSGVPAGGTTGQKLVKLSNTNGDAGWASDPALSSQAQAVLGTDNATLMTPLRVAESVASRIVNNLTSVSTNLSLSAAQGKILQDTKLGTSRLVDTGVGLLGGGDLSADRTLSADLASQAEAQAGTNNTRLMTSLRVKEAISANVLNSLSSTSTNQALSAAQGKILNDEKAPLASPALSGTPSAPTAAPGTNSVQIATTAFVAAAIAGLGGGGGGDVTAAGSNTFTGLNLFRNAGGVATQGAFGQDGVRLQGRAGGIGGNEVILQPTTLSAVRTLTLPNASGTVALTADLAAYATLAGNNAVSGANTFLNAAGQRFAQAAANDAIVVQGRAGGSGSFSVTLTTATLGANRTLTLPDATSTLATTADLAALPTLAGNNSFVGANTFLSASGLKVVNDTASEDAVILAGRDGGTGSLAVTLIPDALTASRTLTLPDKSGTVATIDDIAAGGQLILGTWLAQDALPPAADYMNYGNRNGTLVLVSGDTDEQATTFIGRVPPGVTLPATLRVKVWACAQTATTGAYRLGAQIERSTTDLDANSYASAVEINTTTNGTSGVETITNIILTALDGLASGDRFRLRVYREANDGVNDTLVGNLQISMVALEGV